MTDTKKLKGYIVANGYTQKKLAILLGLSYQSLNKKIHNKVEFRASEILKLATILKILDTQSVFFARPVD